ncbi:acyl-CoA dehydrogenase family protein [Micromonospora lupini]|uniref:acyl-CoA dehydrogenase family protein n=1 Tax=Micromonospora lupini TaxID=285679 RepID=UPI0033C776DD
MIEDVIRPQAQTVDRNGAFPREGVDALAAAGLLGLASATEVGGGGQGMRVVAEVIERLAAECGSTAMPLGHLAAAGVQVDVRRFDVGVGLHGDHVGGERDAARALAAGEVDAACMIDANHLMFVQEGTLPPEGTRIVAQTGRYDHCNMTVREPASDGVRLFGDLLRGMSYADPQVRPLLDLEGLTAWQEGRTTGYAALADAVDASRFYAPDGRVTAPDYRP